MAVKGSGPKTTKANTPKAVSMPDHQHASVSVRKIDNGYIISRSHDGPKGEYKHTETFTAKRPKISIPVIEDDKPKPTRRGR